MLRDEFYYNNRCLKLPLRLNCTATKKFKSTEIVSSGYHGGPPCIILLLQSCALKVNSDACPAIRFVEIRGISATYIYAFADLFLTRVSSTTNRRQRQDSEFRIIRVLCLRAFQRSDSKSLCIAYIVKI